jgi:hypothetical protein
MGAGLPRALREVGAADVDPGGALGVVAKDDVLLGPNEDELDGVSDTQKEERKRS